MPGTTSITLDEVLADAASPLAGAAADYDPLLEDMGDARVVCLGEATHGTHEFYRERATLTRRLIEEHGFTVVAVEADWPDAYEVNRWVRGEGDASGADQALSGFRRFPAWMWRNRDVLAFVEWLHAYNRALPAGARRAGFYGLDLYSLFTSIQAVLRYLDEVDPEAAARARYRYACFDHAAEDAQTYGYAAEFGVSPSCEREAVSQLVELRQRAVELARRDGHRADAAFEAEQNARVVRDAEEYYRTMFRGRVASWNLRDRHMTETAESLLRFFDRGGGETRMVIWGHNSHVGDARATEMGRHGEWNVGQLMRERLGSAVYLVGLTTSRGSVTAASEWDGPAERKRVRPPLDGSYEGLFHRLATGNFVLPLRGAPAAAAALRDTLLERAIGVIYLPRTERASHYFHASLGDSSTGSSTWTGPRPWSRWTGTRSGRRWSRRRRSRPASERRAQARGVRRRGRLYQRATGGRGAPVRRSTATSGRARKRIGRWTVPMPREV